MIGEKKLTPAPSSVPNDSSAHVRYPVALLRHLRRGCGYPAANTIQRLKELKLFRNRSKRQGRSVAKRIPIAVRKKIPQKTITVKPYKHKEVPRLWYQLPSLFLSNVTSLSNKFDEVSVIVETTNVDIVAITEAWQIAPETCSLHNYETFHRLRTNKRGGGVVVLCRTDLHPTPLDVIVPEGIEAVWLRAAPASHPRQCASMIICVIYHPPRAPTAQTLIEHLIHTSDQQRSKFPAAKLVICGDFNQLDTRELQHQLNLKQIVEFPTHNNTTLDLILTDLTDLYSHPQPLPPVGRSTHLSILWSPTPTTSQPPRTELKTYRPITDSAWR